VIKKSTSLNYEPASVNQVTAVDVMDTQGKRQGELGYLNSAIYVPPRPDTVDQFG